MEYKFTDFMKELDGRLDSIHGNRGNLPENSPYLYEMDLKADATELEKAEHMAKEKLWMIDKGKFFCVGFYGWTRSRRNGRWREKIRI